MRVSWSHALSLRVKTLSVVAGAGVTRNPSQQPSRQAREAAALLLPFRARSKPTAVAF